MVYSLWIKVSSQDNFRKIKKTSYGVNCEDALYSSGIMLNIGQTWFVANSEDSEDAALIKIVEPDKRIKLVRK